MRRAELRLQKPAVAHRRLAQKLSARQGYPALFFGNGCYTKLLVEIASAEPVAFSELPEARLTVTSTLHYHLSKLLAFGIVRRFNDPNQARFLIALDSRHPLAIEIRALLRVVALGVDTVISKTPFLDESLTPVEENLKLDAMSASDRGYRDRFLALFGTPMRTKALVFIALIESIDPSTIARLLGMKVNLATKSLHRIEQDELVECEISSRFNHYNLKEVPWTAELRNLMVRICDESTNLRELVEAGRAMTKAGRYRDRPRPKGIIR